MTSTKVCLFDAALTYEITRFIDSAYIFIGGLNYELTEGDVITVFSQYAQYLHLG